jgi:P27 family predicted phage terminase small subunit
MAGNNRSGRKPVPRRIREIEGNKSHRKLRNEPKAKGNPTFPSHLTADHAALWDDTLDALPAGVITAADASMLELFVCSWEAFRASTRLILRTGLLIQTPEGPRLNPLLRARAQAAHTMKGSASELGLSPASRARLLAPKKQEDDPMELLLGMDGDADVARGMGG